MDKWRWSDYIGKNRKLVKRLPAFHLDYNAECFTSGKIEPQYFYKGDSYVTYQS